MSWYELSNLSQVSSSTFQLCVQSSLSRCRVTLAWCHHHKLYGSRFPRRTREGTEREHNYVTRSDKRNLKSLGPTRAAVKEGRVKWSLDILHLTVLLPLTTLVVSTVKIQILFKYQIKFHFVQNQQTKGKLNFISCRIIKQREAIALEQLTSHSHSTRGHTTTETRVAYDDSPWRAINTWYRKRQQGDVLILFQIAIRVLND